MARQILPTETELATLASLNDVRVYAGLPQPVWDMISLSLGTVPSLRVLAMNPSRVIGDTVQGLQIPVLETNGNPRLDSAGNLLHRPLSMVESLQFSLMWRIARQACGLEDYDIFQPPVASPADASAPASAPSSVGSKIPPNVRKVNVSQVADQLDDTELEVMDQAVLDAAFNHYRSRMGSEPLKESEPTAEQVTVLPLGW